MSKAQDGSYIYMDKSEIDLLLAEFREAWAHYRHMEVSRGQYLGYFFTVTLASLGYFINVLNSRAPTRSLIMGVCLYAVVLYALDTLIFTSVKKLGINLRHYEDVIYHIRIIILKDSIRYEPLLNIRKNSNHLRSSRIFGLQTTAEWILKGAGILLVAGYLSVLWWATRASVLADWNWWILFAAGVSMLALEAYVDVKLLREKTVKSLTRV